MWWVIAASALLSGILGWIVIGFGGLVEGVSIIIAGLFIILVTSLADWAKDKSFVNL
jgi:hypothetical protein